MIPCSCPRRPSAPAARIASARRGIALPIVLLFLLIITIAVSFGIRRATLTEGITRNQLDYEVARQAAEAALQDAERDLRLVLPNNTKPAGAVCARNDERPVVYRTGAPWFDTSCPRGQCRYPLAYYNASNYTTSPATNPQPWWPENTDKLGKWNSAAVDPKTSCTFSGAVPLGTFTGTPAIKGVARQPEYLVEYMARGDDVVMRITARGFGFDLKTETVLQSYYRPL